MQPPDDAQAGPVDPDVDLHVPAQRSELRDQRGVLAAVATGGALGSAARYGVALLLPSGSGAGFPWATFTVNAVGCLLIGVLMVLVTERPGAHPLLRPLLGTGVLGGFTTFSAYTVDALALLRHGDVAIAAGYLLLTALTALAAVGGGVTATRLATRPRHGDGRGATRGARHGGVSP